MMIMDIFLKAESTNQIQQRTILKCRNFEVGGRLFFGKLNGFPKTNDFDLCRFSFEKKNFNFYIQKSIGNTDFFDWYVPNLLIYDYSKCPMALGKFLNPEILEFLKIDFNDLIPLFEKYIYKVKDRHKYQIYIFECYKENKGTFLTEKQLNEAYKIYLNVRSNK